MNLPRLSNIRIRSPLKTCFKFLESTIYSPSYAKLLIDAECTEYSEALQTARDLQDVITTTLGRLDFDMDTLTMRFPRDKRYVGYCFDRIRKQDRPSITIFSPRQIEIPEFLPRLMGLPFLQHLEAFSIDSQSPEYASRAFWEACGKLPNLSLLKIWVDHPELLEVLRVKPKLSTPTDPPPYFRSLKFLHLRENWKRQKSQKDEGRSDERRGTWQGLCSQASTNFVSECEWNAFNRGSLYGKAFKYLVLDDSQRKLARFHSKPTTRYNM